MDRCLAVVVLDKHNLSVFDATLPFGENFFDAVLFVDASSQFPATATESVFHGCVVESRVKSDVLNADHDEVSCIK